MKTSVFSIFLLLAFSIVTLAQEKPKKTPEQKAEESTNKLTGMLSLTPDQVIKVRALNLDKAQKIEAAKDKFKTDKANLSTQIKQIKKEWEVQLKTLLTPAQIATYDKFKAEEKAKRDAKKLQKKNKDPKDKKGDDTEEGDDI